VPAFFVSYFIPRGSKWHSERIIEINWGPLPSDSPLLDAVAATTEDTLTHQAPQLLTDPKPPPSPPPSHYFCCRAQPQMIKYVLPPPQPPIIILILGSNARTSNLIRKKVRPRKFRRTSCFTTFG